MLVVRKMNKKTPVVTAAGVFVWENIADFAGVDSFCLTMYTERKWCEGDEHNESG